MEGGLSRIPRQTVEAASPLGHGGLKRFATLSSPGSPAVLTGSSWPWLGALGKWHLMLVAKLAPELPLDSTFPFFSR